MKKLDKTKAYDLRDLNDEQRKELLNYMRSNFEKWQKTNVIFDDSILIYTDDRWWQCCLSEVGNIELTNTLTLFEPQLKIGDTFEKDGFICRVESEVMRWHVVDRGLDAHYTTLTEGAVLLLRSDKIRVTEITDQEFIKQLEKHAI